MTEIFSGIFNEFLEILKIFAERELMTSVKRFTGLYSGLILYLNTGLES